MERGRIASSRTSSWERVRRNRRSELLRVAGEIFADGGYEAASMRDIAKAAGVTVATLYSYFGSKIGLFEAALEHWIELCIPEPAAALPVDQDSLFDWLCIIEESVASHSSKPAMRTAAHMLQFGRHAPADLCERWRHLFDDHLEKVKVALHLFTHCHDPALASSQFLTLSLARTNRNSLRAADLLLRAYPPLNRRSMRANC